MHNPNQSRCIVLLRSHNHPFWAYIPFVWRLNLFSTPPNKHRPWKQLIPISQSQSSPISWQGRWPLGVRENHWVVRSPMFITTAIPSKNHATLSKFVHDNCHPLQKSSIFFKPQPQAPVEPSILLLDAKRWRFPHRSFYPEVTHHFKPLDGWGYHAGYAGDGRSRIWDGIWADLRR